MDDQKYLLFRPSLSVNKIKYYLIGIVTGKNAVDYFIKNLNPKDRKNIHIIPTSKSSIDKKDSIVTKNTLIKKYKQKIKFYKHE